MRRTIKNYLEKLFFGFRLKGKTHLNLNKMCYLVSEREIKADARSHKVGPVWVYCVMKGTKKMEKIIEKGGELIPEEVLMEYTNRIPCV